MMEKGTLLRTTTRTLGDVFGEVLWEVAEIGLDAHDKDRPGAMDGVKCVMLGGTGPSARPGYVVRDSEWNIERDVASGTTVVFLAEKKAELMEKYGAKK
jgi:hypothetical protein